MKLFSTPQKNTNGERGQSLVELAFSLIVLLSLLLGAVEFSLALFQYVTIRDAAQEGALYGSINPTDEAGIKARAVAAAGDVLPNLPTGAVTVEPTNPGKFCEGLTNGAPNALTVTIIFPHEIFLPLVEPMIGTGTINLRASVTDTILSPSCPLPSP